MKNSKLNSGNTLLITLVGVGAILTLGAVFFFATQNNNESAETANTIQEISESDTAEGDGSVMEQDNSDSTDSGQMMEEDSDVKEFTLDATNYAYSQETITVNQGDTVVINVVIEEGFHDIVIDEFDAASEQASAGNTVSIEFVAGETGEYEYYCSVGNHRQLGMVGTLIVQ